MVVYKHLLTSYMTSHHSSEQGACMHIWPVQDAKARFSELLDTCLEDGPQVVSRRGAEAAVLVPIAQWRKLQASSQPTLKDLLLSAAARADLDVPARGKRHRRVAEALD
jgi:antitoxin Phd